MSGIPPSALAHLNASKIPIQSLILGIIWCSKTGLEGTEGLAGSLTGRSVNVAAGSGEVITIDAVLFFRSYLFQ